MELLAFFGPFHPLNQNAPFLLLDDRFILRLSLRCLLFLWTTPRWGETSLVDPDAPTTPGPEPGRTGYTTLVTPPSLSKGGGPLGGLAGGPPARRRCSPFLLLPR